MFNFEKILPKKKNPERFAKTKNPVDDPIEETLDYWKQVSITGLPENNNSKVDKDMDVAA